MQLWDVPPADVRAPMVEEREDLLALLAELTEAEWVAPTEAGAWRVKDVALHVLDGDLGLLSRDRDGDPAGLLPVPDPDDPDGYRDFVAALDAKNERWVAAADGLSRPVVADLLRWSGTAVERWLESVDLREPSRVMWAAAAAVPRWFDLARAFTERWVHQQHIRDAVDRQGDHARFLPPVLRTFVWGFPHQYAADAAEDTIVAVDLDVGGAWTLTRTGGGWTLGKGDAGSPAARLGMRGGVAWRQLTGLPVPASEIHLEGDPALTGPLLDVQGIIV